MKRVFIVGSPRSGTTWTALLLSQHPEIQACQQIGAISTLHKFRMFWNIGEVHTRYHSSVISFGGAERGEASAPTYSPLMTKGEMLAVSRTMLDQVYGFAQQFRPSARVVVDSTPENALMPDLMKELMPEALYLHIIRDPRSVFASHRRASEDFGARFPRDPVGSVEFWRKHLTQARQLQSEGQRYKELRYEALKQDGVNELMSILNWIGVTADRDWCEQVLTKTSIEKLQSTKGTPKSFFRAGNASGWRKDLTSQELQTVEYCARDLMQELGYRPEHPKFDQKPIGMAARELARRVKGRVTGAKRS